jgi:hypothetical protein
MPVAITLLFGAERLRCDPPDPAVLAEDTVFTMLENVRRFNINAGDCAALVVLDCVARLCAYDRAPLPVILAALAASVPAREAALRDANRQGIEPPSLSTAKLAITTGCRLH